MNTNSNSYIFTYAIVMVVVVAAALSTAATLLKPKQQQNVKNEKMSAILASANIASTAKDVATLYDQYIVKELVISPKGDIISTYENGQLQGTQRAFDLNLKTEQFKESKQQDYGAPLFICQYEGKTYYIVPLLGKGLWGPVWGNIAFESDFNTIKGVVFDHKGETPGLGAEIVTPAFQQQFVNKSIFNTNGEFVSVKVQKGGVATLPANMQTHGVDAISGGTITSTGVDEMLKNCLKNYVPYIKNQR